MTPPQAQIVTGRVHHHRLRPRAHRFDYPACMLLLPLRSLRERPDPQLARNRRALLAFHDADHGDGRADCLQWLEKRLAEAGIHDADGEVWLQTYPRVLGYAFKPVSFWYCLRRDTSPAAVLAEVHNTFGERHAYLITGPQLAWGRAVDAHKVFHVSPFMRVEGRYVFRFGGVGPRMVARIELHDEHGLLLATSIFGHAAPATRTLQRQVLCTQPLMSLAVIVRIHWQALRLWVKRVPWFSKPAPPAEPVSVAVNPATRSR
jgi:DUF1365 family protein